MVVAAVAVVVVVGVAVVVVAVRYRAMMREKGGASVETLPGLTRCLFC